MIEIIQGDCLEIMKRYPDNHFDLVLTDPPYGVSIGKSGTVGGGSFRGATQRFESVDWDKQRVSQGYFSEMMRVSRNQIVWGGNYYLDYLYATRCMLIWYKRDGLPTRTFADCEIAWTSFDHNALVFNSRWDGFIRDSKEFKVAHPTQKALSLFKWCLKEFAKPNYKILDPFLGSGTTTRACKDMGFECVGIEINADYVKVAENRLGQEVLL